MKHAVWVRRAGYHQDEGYLTDGPGLATSPRAEHARLFASEAEAEEAIAANPALIRCRSGVIPGQNTAYPIAAPVGALQLKLRQAVITLRLTAEEFALVAKALDAQERISHELSNPPPPGSETMPNGVVRDEAWRAGKLAEAETAARIVRDIRAKLGSR